MLLIVTIEKMILKKKMMKQLMWTNYITDEYKDLVDNYFEVQIKGWGFASTELDNQKLGLTNIANNYLEKRYCIG